MIALKESGFEQCPADPCVMRMMLGNELVASIVMHVDDLLIEDTMNMSDVVVNSMGEVFPTKLLGELAWYMGSEVCRNLEEGT